MMQSTDNPLLANVPKVTKYLRKLASTASEPRIGVDFTLTPLARGEYNLNYLVTDGSRKLVFRLNMGTQINRKDQVSYEYKALKLLENSGVTPRPYFVDDSRSHIDRGVLLMEYLPGEPLDYLRDSAAAARTLARIHQVEINGEQNHLIVENEPLGLILRECEGLLEVYLTSELADPDIRTYLAELLEWARTQAATEEYFLQDPWHVIVNTEVNSGNFIVNRNRRTVHLVDWEMPRWGDPSSDLCHFLSPLTTLWKTSFRFSPSQEQLFLDEYKRHFALKSQQNSLEQRLRLKMPFVLLRGISWSAMGWVAYRQNTAAIRNEDTQIKLDQYMNLDFIRSCFAPYFKS